MNRSLRRTRTYWSNKTRRILVEGARVGKAQWLGIFRRLLADFEAHAHVLSDLGSATSKADEDPDARELLIWAWVSLKAMPFSVAQDYLRLREAGDDRYSLPTIVERIREDGFKFDSLYGSVELQLLWTAALVRVADADLSSISYWPEDPATWMPGDWQVQGYPCFVVPVQREYRMEDGKPRERRGMRFHAIVPSSIGEYEVELHLHPGLHGDPTSSPERMRYGAALFRDLTVDVENIGSAEFAIRGAPAPDWEAQLSRHVEDARNGGCDVLTLPELTMPPERVELLTSALRSGLFSAMPSIPIVAAGSWHVIDSDELVNRMEVLDGRGQRLLFVDKRSKYVLKGRLEAIRPGRKVPLLVTRNRLIGFAICLDFCEDRDVNVFRDISSDLVVVPSLGDRSSVEAHLRHAKAIQSAQGSVALIVQQTATTTGSARKKDEPLGYSFARPLSAMDAADGPPSVVQNEPFRELMARI